MTDKLRIDNMTVNYGQTKILENISMHINSSEIICLIGSNGAGKSTLLKAIMGIIPPVYGHITYNTNMDITKLSTHKIVELGICLVPEGRQIFSEMTIQENLEMGAFLIKNKKNIKTLLDRNYELFPVLYDRRKQKAGYLSGGEQQMLAIGRALMNSPKILLLDEPSLGLAPLMSKNIFDKINEIRDINKTSIILIEQNAKMALIISDRGYILENGQITLEGKCSTLLESPQIKTAYLGG
ncbi:MAG: ABC transporter ATP-binding protein [Candidatus Margulisbacteria bacterium]|nr:ABC transporter ATP-binding protein [Candidatus Margulisiibacteriota bacterium]